MRNLNTHRHHQAATGPGSHLPRQIGPSLSLVEALCLNHSGDGVPRPSLIDRIHSGRRAPQPVRHLAPNHLYTEGAKHPV
jgi:hypothetical protein